jgi:hypothetical protein
MERAQDSITSILARAFQHFLTIHASTAGNARADDDRASSSAVL